MKEALLGQLEIHEVSGSELAAVEPLAFSTNAAEWQQGSSDCWDPTGALPKAEQLSGNVGFQQAQDPAVTKVT